MVDTFRVPSAAAEAAELHAVVPREGAWLREGESEEGRTLIRANCSGFLGIGIEFLKAGSAKSAAAPDPSRQDRIEVDLDYLAGEEICYEFDRLEAPPPEPPSQEAAMGKLGVAIAVTIVFAFFATLAVGVVTILRWLVGFLF